MSEYNHYIAVDQNGIVIDGYADWQTDKRRQGEIQLSGDFGRHFQLNLLTDRQQFKYKLANNQMGERTQAELDTEWAARPAPPPSTQDEVVSLKSNMAKVLLTLAKNNIK